MRSSICALLCNFVLDSVEKSRRLHRRATNFVAIEWLLPSWGSPEVLKVTRCGGDPSLLDSPQCLKVFLLLQWFSRSKARSWRRSNKQLRSSWGSPAVLNITTWGADTISGGNVGFSSINTTSRIYKEPWRNRFYIINKYSLTKYPYRGPKQSFYRLPNCFHVDARFHFICKTASRFMCTPFFISLGNRRPIISGRCFSFHL